MQSVRMLPAFIPLRGGLDHPMDRIIQVAISEYINKTSLRIQRLRYEIFIIQKNRTRRRIRPHSRGKHDILFREFIKAPGVSFIQHPEESNAPAYIRQPHFKGCFPGIMGQPQIVGDDNSGKDPDQTKTNKGIDDREPFCILEPGPTLPPIRHGPEYSLFAKQSQRIFLVKPLKIAMRKQA